MSRIVTLSILSLLAFAAAPAAAQYGGSPDQQVDPPTALAGKGEDQANAPAPGRL